MILFCGNYDKRTKGQGKQKATGLLTIAKRDNVKDLIAIRDLNLEASKYARSNYETRYLVLVKGNLC